MRDESEETSLRSSHSDRSKVVKEVRDDRGVTSLRSNLPMFKVVKEVRDDRGDTSLS